VNEKDLRLLPTPPLRPERRRAVGLRAGDAFDEAHRGRIRMAAAVRFGLGVALAGAALVYLLWAMHTARTFG